MPPSGARYYAGWFFFILTIALPVAGLLVPSLGLPPAKAAIITGAMVVGGPEIAMVLAVACWGKETFHYFMGRLKSSLTPPATVSPARYYVGLAMFVSSALPSWLFAYFPQWLSDGNRIPVLATADFLFIASFFVAGGEFWGKIRALFIAGNHG